MSSLTIHTCLQARPRRFVKRNVRDSQTRARVIESEKDGRSLRAWKLEAVVHARIRRDCARTLCLGSLEILYVFLHCINQQSHTSFSTLTNSHPNSLIRYASQEDAFCLLPPSPNRTPRGVPSECYRYSVDSRTGTGGKDGKVTFFHWVY